MHVRISSRYVPIPTISGVDIGIVRVLASYRSIRIKNKFSFLRVHSALTKFLLINEHYVVEELFHFYNIQDVSKPLPTNLFFSPLRLQPETEMIAQNILYQI